jgi:hypothetical protein
MATKPESFNVLPCINRHTPDGREIFSAMFIPAYITYIPVADNRGWIDPVKGKKYYDSERLKKAKDPSGLLMYKAEFCYTIEEALIGEGDNIFPREELAEQEAAITIYKTVEEPKNGHLA